MKKFATTMACIDSLVAALQADSDLAAMIAVQSPGHVLSFFIGYDEQEFPVVSAAPYLVLMPGPFGPNSERTADTHTIQIALVIEKGTKTTSGVITKYAGLEAVEKMARNIDSGLMAWIENNFADGYTKTPFQTAIIVPAVKTVWTYEFQDQN